MPESTVMNPITAPVGVDRTRASVARVYDAFLGGKDNYEIDREVLRRAQRVVPGVRELALANRGFAMRACRFLARHAGLTQFVDCGPGMPTDENTHQVVQRVDPETKVVYVDNDPVVVAHGRALLEENDHVHFISGDAFQPARLMGDEYLRTYLDLTQPVGLLQTGTLHHCPGDRCRPAEVMRELVEFLPSGSFVVISHFFDPENELSALARRLEYVFESSRMGSGTFRTKAEIEELFPGLEMVPPGVVRCVDWWPDGPPLESSSPALDFIVGGIGRKP